MIKIHFLLKLFSLIFLNPKIFIFFLSLELAITISIIENQSKIFNELADSNIFKNLKSYNDCTQVNHQLAIRLKLDAIQKQILSKLKLKNKPNVTLNFSKNWIQEAIQKLSEEGVSTKPSQEISYLDNNEGYNLKEKNIPLSYQFSDSPDDYYGKLSEFIIFPKPEQKFNGNTLLELSLPDNNVNKLQVTSAHLWIYLRLHPILNDRVNQNLENQKLTLYIFKVKSSSNSGLNLEKLTSLKVPKNKLGWKNIDLKEAIQKWFTNLVSIEEKLTLLVDCSGCDSLFQLVLFSPTSDSDSDDLPNLNEHGLKLHPFLIINTTPKAAERSKRHAITCSYKIKHCCKQPLYVNFTELGWNDWVIQPAGYFANYCVGDCSQASQTPNIFASFYSQIIDQHRRRNPFASIAPCCVPTRLSPITLLYFGMDNTIIKADLPKMVVEECGCT